MKSMTGYAKRKCVVNGKELTIEIKTLNSKQIDAVVKLPFAYRGKELEIRTILNHLGRGKIDCLISEANTQSSTSNLNKELVVERYKALQDVAEELDCKEKHLLEIILAQPDVWYNESDEELSENDWEILRQAVEKTVEEVDQFRVHEGGVLEKDFVIHVNLIEQKLHSLEPYEAERIGTAKDRIRKYLSESDVKEVDENRFEQELIYYLEKLDITEEKVRLQKHINYFRDTMKENDCGKKLAFIAQEMGREINTTGSKANHVEIQKLVVEMKDELEKIKEQLGNIL